MSEMPPVSAPLAMEGSGLDATGHLCACGPQTWLNMVGPSITWFSYVFDVPVCGTGTTSGLDGTSGSMGVSGMMLLSCSI